MTSLGRLSLSIDFNTSSMSAVTQLNDRVQKVEYTVGKNDVEPKTGIYKQLDDVERAETIIPHYEQASMYYVLLNKKYEIDYNSKDFCYIHVNNQNNSNLNYV